MEARKRNELECVTHRGQFALELRDGGVVECGLPVERRRAVVREQLVRKLSVQSFGVVSREVEVRRAGFAPRSDRRTARRPGRAEIAASIPPRTRKKPSAVRSPVQKRASRSSTSLVSSVARECISARNDDARNAT